MNKGNKHRQYAQVSSVLPSNSNKEGNLFFPALFQFYEDNSGRLEHVVHVIHTHDLCLTSSCLEREKDVSWDFMDLLIQKCKNTQGRQCLKHLIHSSAYTIPRITVALWLISVAIRFKYTDTLVAQEFVNLCR